MKLSYLHILPHLFKCRDLKGVAQIEWVPRVALSNSEERSGVELFFTIQGSVNSSK